MNFTLNTKPFSDSLNLGVITNNISKFYSKSCLAQLTASKGTLRVNLEASYISSEIILKGSGDAEGESVAFVDCSLLRQLVNTFESSTITIEYADGGVVLHSGTSKFTLPSMAEGVDLELKRPSEVPAGAASVKLNGSDWKFVKDHQMFAIAMSFVHPIYTKVWASESGEIIVGDFDNSLFTLSKKNKLGRTCLLSDTVINLFNSVPEGSSLTQLGDSYRIDVKTDGFEYAAEFTPQYESDPGVGSYSSDVILEMLQYDPALSAEVPVNTLSKFLGQAELLSRSGDDTLTMTLDGSTLQLKDANVDCKLPVKGDCPAFKAEFRTAFLKSMLANVDAEAVHLYPIIQEDSTVGVIAWTDNLAIVLGGVED